MSRGLADCKAYALATMIASVARSGPALPSAWLVEVGPWALWALGVPAGHRGQLHLLQDSTLHTPFCTVQTGLGCQGCKEPLHT